MPSVKTPPWAPQALTPLSTGSLTLTIQRGAKPTGKSLTAAGTRVTASPIRDRITRHITGVASKAWQEEVLEFAGLVPELRYITNTTANAASRAWVYPAGAKDSADSTSQVSPQSDEAPEEEGAPPGAVDPEIVRRCAQLMVLIGEIYVVELPAKRGRPGKDSGAREVHVLAPMDVAFTGNDTVRLWGRASGNGGSVTGGKEFPLKGPGAAKVTRIHRPDARNAEEPDSPARSALPILRQIVGLGMHVDATIDSKVSSAGIVEYPVGATVSRPTGSEGSEEFADALQDAMGDAMEEPSSSWRVVPILVGMPLGAGGTGEKSALKWHMPPGSVLDSHVHVLLEDNIRRLALGMDAPPEVILGSAGVSHFGAWSIEGEFIRLQVAPLLKLIADGLSVAFETEYTFDTGPLTVRPNKAVEAQALYDRGAISLATLRASSGFSEDDALKFDSKEEEALYYTRKRLSEAPSLYQSPGAPAVLDQERILVGLPPVNAAYYPSAEKTPANPVADPREPDPGNQPESNRPVSDGSPEGGADGVPHDVPGTD